MLSMFMFLNILFFILINFSKKLLVLLGLEGLMLVLIYLGCVFFTPFYFSYFFFIVISVFTVLDSVFGISVVVSCSRNSSSFSFSSCNF